MKDLWIVVVIHQLHKSTVQPELIYIKSVLFCFCFCFCFFVFFFFCNWLVSSLLNYFKYCVLWWWLIYCLTLKKKRVSEHDKTTTNHAKERENLESTDVAGRVPHSSLMRLNTGRSVWLGCPCVGAASELFFFFFFLDSCWLGFDSHRFVSNRADSARIGPYRSATKTAETDQNGWNRPWI